MPHLDEGTIHAWLEGGLPPDEATLTEEHIASCDECSSAVAEARGLIAASSRILTALDDVPSGVIPARMPKPRPWYMRREFQAAAAMLIVAGSTLLVMRGGQREIASKAALSISSPVMDTGALPPAVATTEASAAPSANQEAQQKKTEAAATTAPQVGRRLLEKPSAKTDARDEVKSVAADVATAQSAITGNISGFARSSRQDSAMRQDVFDLAAQPRIIKVERHIGYEPWITYEVAPGVQVTLVRESSRELSQVVVTGTATESAKQTLNATVRPKAARDRGKESAPSAPSARDTTARAMSGVVSGVAIAPPHPAAAVPSALGARMTLSAQLDSIQWIDPKTGNRFKLIGPLTREQLEVVKTRLPELKQ
jgi:anti-sigma factor RsiW